MKRRDVLLTVAGIPFFGLVNAQSRVPISDAHNHIGLLRKNKESVLKLGDLMTEAGVSLLSWTVVPDAPFLRISSNGVEQGRSISAGELKASFDRQLSNASSGLVGNGVSIVKTVADLDKAANGIPHVVLTSEGADFLEGSLDDLQYAYDRGIRHIQLVHYIKNPVGDLQTERPTHNGLSDFGKQLIKALNVTGILIDLAHSTGPSIDQALEISSKPMIWSHSFVTKSEQSWTSRGYMSRGLSEAYAKKIASKGGAVGLWALGASFGGGIDGYASEIIRMIEILGADHVMFGTDEDGLPQGAVIEQLIDLRKVVDILAKRGVDEKTLRSVAYENYARCLRKALQG
jgi:membrane dipeptidase